MSIRDVYHMLISALIVIVVYIALKLKYRKPDSIYFTPDKRLPKLNIDYLTSLTICKRICSFVGLETIGQTIALRGKMEIIMKRSHNYENYRIKANFKQEPKISKYLLSHIIEDVFFVRLVIRYNGNTAPVEMQLNDNMYYFSREELPELSSCWA